MRRAQRRGYAESIHFKVVNVVASTQLSRAVDLRILSAALEDALYDQEHFAGMIYRRKEPRATIILFGNGKFVSTGTTSERDARMALQSTLREICLAERLSARMAKIHTVNLVATADLGERLDLRKISTRVPEASYEPEAFPGMIFRNPDRSAVLVFGSGKVVCSGSRSGAVARDHINEVHRKLTDGSKFP